MQLSPNKLHCVMLLFHGLAQVGDYLAPFFKGAYRSATLIFVTEFLKSP